ncbi:MAG TPA: Clp protease N-terminal domain-containing protein [Solirubrobacteraceae bacterium]|nr:Clp protease N-terminal domain-containing protein [Solirubrobacteraceae bacterium]
MFERFTEDARQVVVLAQEEARTLRHNYIGTEHILLGLLREQEGLAARVLESLEVSIERVRGQVVRIVGPGEEVTSGQIPFTPRAKKVLELALREALALAHDYIGTEHILLGLVRENEGVATRILLDFDADAEKIRNRVLRMLSGTSARLGEHGPTVRIVAGPEGGLQPRLRWDDASVRAGPDGPELLVPIQLEQRACALLANSAVWQHTALAGARHEVARGRVRLSSPSLLESVDPRELRRLLDAALAEAHEEALRARSREAVLAEAFLAALQEEPQR